MLSTNRNSLPSCPVPNVAARPSRKRNNAHLSNNAPLHLASSANSQSEKKSKNVNYDSSSIRSDKTSPSASQSSSTSTLTEFFSNLFFYPLQVVNFAKSFFVSTSNTKDDDVDMIDVGESTEDSLKKTISRLIPESSRAKYAAHPIIWEMMSDTIDRRSLTQEEFDSITSSCERSSKIDALFSRILFNLPSNYFVIHQEVKVDLKKIVATVQVQIPNQISDKTSFFELFLRAIAIRIVLEIRRHNIGFPYRVISQKEADEDFVKLKNYQFTGDQLTQLSIGRKTSNFYTMKERMKVPQVGCSYGPSVAWSINNLLFTVVRSLVQTHLIGKQIQDVECLDNVALRNYHARNKAVDQFRPVVVLETIVILRKLNPNYRIDSAFDPCGGWGERLVGFLAANITTIVYNDVNEALKESYTQIVTRYAHQGQQVHLLFKPAEDLTIDEMCPNKKEHNFIFSGLPFFTKEKYLGENQAHRRYPQLGDWLNNFLYKTVIHAGATLSPTNSYMVLNIDDFKDRGNTFSIVDPLKYYIKTHIAFLTLINIDLRLPRAALNNATREGLTDSPMLVIKRNGKAVQSVDRFFSKASSHRQSCAAASSSSTARTRDVEQEESSENSDREVKRRKPW